MSTTGMLWQLMLNATPRQVFGALVATTSSHGRLLSVENFGTALTFAPAGASANRCVPLRATVRTSEHGTLVSFAPAEHGLEIEDPAAQAESVGSLIRQLRQRVEPCLQS
jgi:hypothetical protein